MKSLTVIFTDQALCDLEEIWLYTFQNWSLTQADRYHSMIINEVEFLSVNPKSGKNQSHVRKGYYSSKINSHIIFYKVVESELEVIRILHENMDLPNRLNE